MLFFRRRITSRTFPTLTPVIFSTGPGAPIPETTYGAREGTATPGSSPRAVKNAPAAVAIACGAVGSIVPPPYRGGAHWGMKSRPLDAVPRVFAVVVVTH